MVFEAPKQTAGGQENGTFCEKSTDICPYEEKPKFEDSLLKKNYQKFTLETR